MMWRGDKTCNLVNVTAHRRQPISSAALAATYLKVAGGNVRAELLRKTAQSIMSCQNTKGAAIFPAFWIMKSLPYMQATVNDRLVNPVFRRPLLAVPFILRKARDRLSQKHESQQVIIADGGPIKMYHWDKKGNKRLAGAWGWMTPFMSLPSRGQEK